MKGITSFERDFEGYRNGFGVPQEDYYLGNENLHQLTKSDDYEVYFLTETIDTSTKLTIPSVIFS